VVGVILLLARYMHLEEYVVSEWNPSQQEIAQIKILIRLNKDQSDLEKRAEEFLSPLSGDVNTQRQDIFLSQIVAREQYLRLLSKLVHFKSTPDADMAAMDALIDELVAAKLVYRATHELQRTS
jgi:hypothetical protein